MEVFEWNFHTFITPNQEQLQEMQLSRPPGGNGASDSAIPVYSTLPKLLEL